MLRKCKKCAVPLEGFLYRWIAFRLLGVKPSKKDTCICNKCEEKERR